MLHARLPYFRRRIAMSGSKLSRKHLLALAIEIQNAQDAGQDCSALVAKFQASVPYPDVEDLFLTDYPPESIVDFASNWKVKQPKLSKQEMVTLVGKILDAEGSEAEINLMIRTFEANCAHPAKSDLIFFPDEHFNGNDDPSPEEIVEKALSKE
jgi:hypothetical protein